MNYRSQLTTYLSSPAIAGAAAIANIIIVIIVGISRLS